MQVRLVAFEVLGMLLTGFYSQPCFLYVAWLFALGCRSSVSDSDKPGSSQQCSPVSQLTGLTPSSSDHPRLLLLSCLELCKPCDASEEYLVSSEFERGTSI